VANIFYLLGDEVVFLNKTNYKEKISGKLSFYLSGKIKPIAKEQIKVAFDW